MPDLTETVREIEELYAQRVGLVQAYEARIREIDDALAALNRKKGVISKGFDASKVDRAKSLLRVQGDPRDVRRGRSGSNGDTRSKAVADAIKDLAMTGGEYLRGQYIGVKNYDAFGDQREDHKYGMGPRHGSIVFSIGLVERRELDEDEVEDCIYYLTNLSEILSAAESAA